MPWRLRRAKPVAYVTADGATVSVDHLLAHTRLVTSALCLARELYRYGEPDLADRALTLKRSVRRAHPNTKVTPVAW